MLTLEHFLTREGLVDLLSVATYGNYWPDVTLTRDDPSESDEDDQEIYLWRIEE